MLLFLIALPVAIATQTITIAIVVAHSRHSLFSSLSPLRLFKSDNYIYSDSWKSDITKWGAIQKRSHEPIYKNRAKRLRAIDFVIAKL